MILYEKGTTDFTRNGLGYINDVLSAKVIDELNGEYSLTFEYPTTGIMSDELLEGRIVKCKVSDGTKQCFIIKNVVKKYDKMTITCSHLFYLLLDDLAEDIYPQNLSPKPFLDWVLARANYQLPFQTTSDVSIQKSGRYVRKNIVDVILGDADNSMVNLFGIDIKRNNFNIALNSRIGADRGEKLIYGKNITGINITTDANSVYTRIMPVGYDGLLLPEKYIDADNINDYPYPKIGIFEFSDIRYDPDDPNAYQDINDAYAALRSAVAELYDNNISYPSINIKIDWLELSQTEEYKQYFALERVELGDTIHAEIFGLNYTTRVIKTVYNPLNDRIEQFEVGTFQPTIATKMNKYEVDLQTINPSSILEEAKDNATYLITNAMGGYVYKTNDELYIMDNEDPNQAVHVWRWNINGLGYSNTGINGTYGLAMTMDGSIVADFITTGTLRTNVIEGYDSLTAEVQNNTGQIAVLSLNVGELNSKIQDIADITTAEESEYARVDLLNVNESQPIMIKIHPMNNKNISYLYPRANLYPSDTLYMPDRRIKFTNTSTNEVFYYELFDDLLYYDADNYDEFYWDYDNQTIQITKKCEYNANGEVILKSSTQIKTKTFPTPEEFYLTTGNYTITLPGYSNAYLMVRCMASNIYTSQFATHSEISQTASQIRTEVAGTYATYNQLQTVDSRITQTAFNITSQVSQTYETKSNATSNYNTLDSKIDQTATSITSTVSQTYETKTAAQTNYDSLNSTITQTALGINTEVAKKVGKTEIISTINQSAESVTINANKVNISGVITAINNNSSTTINGNKITTGTLSANKISGGVIRGIEFNNGSGTFSVSTGGYLYASSGKIGGWTISSSSLSGSTGDGHTATIRPGQVRVSGSGYEMFQSWENIIRSASDKKVKKDIQDINEELEKFYDNLKPKTFKYVDGFIYDPNKIHFGFIAQDIIKNAKNNNLDNISMVYKTKGNKIYQLDKDEIIALNTWQIQKLKKENQELKNAINELRQEIEKIKKGK